MAEKTRAKRTSTKKTVPVEASEQKIADSEPMARQSDWNLGAIFWGMLLISIGGLVLLGNFGLVRLEWGNVWRIWPVAIIAAGISMLSVRGIAWKLISTLFIALTLIFVMLLAVGAIGPSSGSYRTFTSDVSGNDKAPRTEVTLNGGASKMRITADNMDVAARATLRSNVAEMKEESSVRDGTHYVSFSSESTQGLWFAGSFKNEWNLAVDNDRPMRLMVDAGASDIDIDVSRSQVDELELKAGASSSRITLGDGVVRTKVVIDSGASTVTVRVPRSSGVSLKIDGGLVSKQLADMRQITEDYYETDGFEKAANKIELVADIGAANFTIERY